MKNLGERLRYIRKQKGWSQEKLAHESGVNQGTISKIEREGQYKSVYAFQLAEALGVNSVWLLTGDEAIQIDNVSSGQEISDEEKDILLLYRKLNATNKKSIRDILINLSR